jgi:hypothetical protein
MNPIYQAGHKFIDLERVTAIEPMTGLREGSYGLLPTGEICGAVIFCQLHEEPISAYFQWRHHPSELANPEKTPPKLPADQTSQTTTQQDLFQ